MSLRKGIYNRYIKTIPIQPRWVGGACMIRRSGTISGGWCDPEVAVTIPATAACGGATNCARTVGVLTMTCCGGGGGAIIFGAARIWGGFSAGKLTAGAAIGGRERDSWSRSCAACVSSRVRDPKMEAGHARPTADAGGASADELPPRKPESNVRWW